MSHSASWASPGRGSPPSRGSCSASRTRTRGAVTFEGRPLEASKGGIAKEQRGRVQMVFQDPGDSLDPLMTIEKIVAEPLLLLGGARRGSSGAACPSCSSSSASTPTSAGGAAAALGRPAPAGRDRAGARHRPRAHRLRRGRVVARRLRARADPQPPDGPAAPARALLPVHLARPLHRPARLRPGRGDVRRPVRRGRRRGRDLRGAAAPVHDRAALGGADPEPGARARAAADPARGRAARPDAPVPGCIFASRCWKAQERCTVERAGARHEQAATATSPPATSRRTRHEHGTASSPPTSTTRPSHATRFPVWERLRHEAPLFHDTVDDVYLLTRYDDVAAVLRDDVRTRRGSTRRRSRR